MSDKLQLDGLRQQIDSLDDQILDLVNKRAALAQSVASVKKAQGETVSFYRPEREASILRRMIQNNPGPAAKEGVARIFREIMSACLALEQPLNVAYLGPEGTFTQQAVYQHFGQSVETMPLASIDAVFREVASGNAEYGVVPVENSTEGVVTHTLDSFVKASGVCICGEVMLSIHHNLLSKTDQLHDIEELVSHQQSFAQCRAWLDRHLPNIKRTCVSSNGEAARIAAEKPGLAAIAGSIAAGMYSMTVLQANIEDETDNTTRFLVIGTMPVKQTGKDKTSLLLSADNRPGALYSMLEPFSRHSISMTKIESRPSKLANWDYVFFVDINGHQDDATVSKALDDLQKKVKQFKILGSYPTAVLGA
ncbi:MAG: prephenate dehydratase [Gammaproteobacteria bacterium]|nr:prephenate dehydratase [Gammaproteobacteria bacterium]